MDGERSEFDSLVTWVVFVGVAGIHWWYKHKLLMRAMGSGVDGRCCCFRVIEISRKEIILHASHLSFSLFLTDSCSYVLYLYILREQTVDLGLNGLILLGVYEKLLLMQRLYNWKEISLSFYISRLHIFDFWFINNLNIHCYQESCYLDISRYSFNLILFK